MREDASASRQANVIARDRSRIAAGQRPTYHATWSLGPDGVVDVRVAELPIIHLFVPDRATVGDGARLLIARTLEVGLDTFDVVADPKPSVADASGWRRTGGDA